MNTSIRHGHAARAALALGLLAAAAVAVDAQEIPRTASGRPDLSGTYDTANPDARSSAPPSSATASR